MNWILLTNLVWNSNWHPKRGTEISVTKISLSQSPGVAEFWSCVGLKASLPEPDFSLGQHLGGWLGFAKKQKNPVSKVCCQDQSWQCVYVCVALSLMLLFCCCFFSSSSSVAVTGFRTRSIYVVSVPRLSLMFQASVAEAAPPPVLHSKNKTKKKGEKKFLFWLQKKKTKTKKNKSLGQTINQPSVIWFFFCLPRTRRGLTCTIHNTRHICVTTFGARTRIQVQSFLKFYLPVAFSSSPQKFPSQTEIQIGGR